MPSRKVLLIILAVGIAGLAAFLVYRQLTVAPPPPEMGLNALVAKVHQGEVSRLEIGSDSVKVELRNRMVFTVGRGGKDFLATLERLGVSEDELAQIDIVFLPPPTNWSGILIPIGVLVLTGLFIYWLTTRSSGGFAGTPSGSGSAGKAITGSDRPRTTFDDVGGCDEAKEELKEVVEFLRNPARFTAMGARIPKGVILVGPPGCGKTLMARAVAGEAGVPFFFMSGSEFVEVYVGVGASRVRELFGKAKKNAPAIVFIDEIDAIGGARSGIRSGGDREYQQTLNQILSEMDGFVAGTNVIVLAATNRPDMLDSALTRKGRFDRMVVVDRPDLNGRKLIFDIHLKGKPLASGIDSLRLAQATPGFTGADIESAVNEAAILAARREKKAIDMDDFFDAVEKVLAGPERKSHRVSDRERRIIAYHEAGHALVMENLPLCDPVHKVSIIARGLGLGYTMPLPEEDQYLQSKEELEQKLAGLLGGRAAEEIVFGKDAITSGASNDLERATAVARDMVIRLGMSELGLQSFVVTQEDYLRRGLFGEAGMSPETARLVDREVNRIISVAYEEAKKILSGTRETLDLIAEALLDKETLDADELSALLAES